VLCKGEKKSKLARLMLPFKMTKDGSEKFVPACAEYEHLPRRIERGVGDQHATIVPVEEGGGGE